MNQLDRVLDILELLAERDELSLADAARALKTSRPTAYRVLAALHSRGYVDHIRARHVYRLGPAIRLLAARSNASALARLAAPALADLRASTGETVNLAVVRRNRIVYVAILDGLYALRMAASVGQEAPPHAAALGKAILAALPAAQRDLFLGPEPYTTYTERTLTERAPLDQDLAVTLSRGYAIDNEEVDVSAVCVAAPIIGSEGLPIGALSVSGVAARFPKGQWQAVGQAVRRWADRISSDLGAVDVDLAKEVKG